MARAVGVKSVDDYGAEFALEDGTTRYMFGPEALQYASDLAAMGRVPEPAAEQAKSIYRGVSAAPDRRLASMGGAGGAPSYGGGAPAGGAPVTGGAPATGGGMSDLPEGPTAVAAEPAPAPPDQPQTREQLEQEARDLAGQIAASDPELRGRTVYSAPFDPAAEAARRKPVPTTMTEKREGTKPLYEDVSTAQRELVQERVQLAREQAQLETEAAQRKRAIALAQRPQLLEAQERAKMAEQEIQTRVQSDMRALEAQHKELGNTTFDMHRVFKQKGAAGAIAAFAGAVLYTLGGGDGTKLLQSYIDRDVKLQEMEYNAKRESADNALTDLKLQYGDLEQAKLALKMQQNRVADNFAAEMEAATLDQQAKLRYKQARNELQTQYNDWLTKFRDRAVGNATISVSNEMKSPRAGGVSRLPPKAQGLEAIKRFNEIYDEARRAKGLPTSGQQYELDKEAAHAAREAEKATDDRAYQLQKDVTAGVGEAEGAVQRLVNRTGLKMDKDGRIYNPEGHNIPQVGRVGVGPLSFKAKTVRGNWLASLVMPGGREMGELINQDLDNLRDVLGRMRSGAVISDDEYARFMRLLEGNGSEAEFVNGMNIILDKVRSYRQSLSAGMPVEVHQQVEQNRKDYQEMQPGTGRPFNPQEEGWE